MIEDKSDRCLKCGSEKIIPIVHGRTTFDMVERERAGEIYIAGEGMGNDGSKWHCKDCGYQWGGTGGLL